MSKEEYEQNDLLSLLPSSKGGRALVEKKGSQHLAEIARQAAARRTREERRQIALKAAKERRRRFLHEPRIEVTQTSVVRVVERVIPYWKETKGKRPRKLPEFVRFELSVEELWNKEPEIKYFILEEANRYNDTL